MPITNDLVSLVKSGNSNAHEQVQLSGFINVSGNKVNIGISGYQYDLCILGGTGFLSQICGGDYLSHTLNGANASILAGQNNTIKKDYASCGAGTDNIVSGENSMIAGGQLNRTNASNTFIGGGSQNIVHNVHSTVIAGTQNTLSGSGSFIGAGRSNQSSGIYTVLVGGANNFSDGDFNFLGAGSGNRLSGNAFSSLIGGRENIVRGDYITLLGGSGNHISGDNAFGVGRGIRIPLADQGAMVFADSTNREKSSWGQDTCTFDFLNGVNVTGNRLRTYGSVVCGTGIVDPSPDGYLYLPTIDADVPTATPRSHGGDTVASCFDKSTNKLWIYNPDYAGGSWISVLLS